MSFLDQSSKYYAQAKDGILIHREAVDFIQKHKIYQGLAQHKWILAIILFTAFLLASNFIKVLIRGFNTLSHPEQMLDLDGQPTTMFSSVSLLGEQIFLQSGTKYLLLILLEIIIFYCTVKTLDVLMYQKSTPKLVDFVNAQKRMIKVSLRCWVYEIIITALLSLALGIIGLGIIKSVLVHFVQFYFLGLAFLDNYHEQFHLSIKESFASSKKHMGAAIAIGSVSYFLFLIPLFGAIVGPILGSVSATLYLFYKRENQDILRSNTTNNPVHNV